MSTSVAHPSLLDQFDEFQVSALQWDEKQLVAALESASLSDLMKIMKVDPVKSTRSVRRGRFCPDIVESVANIRLDAGEGERTCLQVNGYVVPAERIQDAMALIESYMKLKVIEEVQRHTSAQIEVNYAPRALRDHLEELTKGRSSFNLVNLGTVVDKYLLWRRTFPRIQPFYAVKSNPDPEISRVLHACGTGFDCASKVELQQILALPGVNPNDIIFANPCKQVEHILYAKENDVSMMTFDNPYELEKIYRHYPGARLVLRLLPDDSHSLMPFGSKFGASFSESQSLIARCKELGMSLIGVSFHVGSGCFSSIAWVEALKLARQVFDEARKYGYIMNLVDIGGGFPGVETGNLPLSAIGPDVVPIVDQLFGPEVRVIAEPGRFFCTQSTTLACTVVSKRERMIGGAGSGEAPERECQLYLSDGIYGSMNCIVFDHVVLEPSPLIDDPARSYARTTMWGPTCDSIDVVVKGVPFPETEIGEWLFFENMGAYTSAAASNFNGFAPPVPVYVLNL